MVLTDIGERSGVFVLGDTLQHPAPPTAEQVISIRREWGQYYKRFHDRTKDVDMYYYGRNPVPKPPDMGVDITRPGTAHGIINVATDHVDVNNPSMFVPEPSPRAKDRAERVKKFLQGAWMQVPPQEKRTAVRYAVGYGLAFKKVTFATESWPDAPILDDFASDEAYREALREHLVARHEHFPFKVQAVHPMNMIWDDSQAGMKWAIETYQTTAREIRASWPEWQSNKSPSAPASWSEYWDDTWVGYMADNQWVWGPHPHGYGFNPYVKVEPATSLRHRTGLPHERYVSILEPAFSLLDAEARLLTQYESIIRQSGWRTLDFFAQSEVAADRAREGYELFGGKNVVPAGVEVKPSPAVQPPAEILGLLSIVQTMIEEVTFPNVVRGVRPRGVSAGYGISVLAGMGRLVFGSYADSMAQATQQVNKRLLMLIENKVKGRVTVRARSETHRFDQTIGPEDIRGFYENVVVMKAEAPEERERESILASRLFKDGVISLYETMRRVGIANPLEEMNQQAAEQILMQLRPLQAEAAMAGVQLPQQLARAADVGPVNEGNQFMPFLGQLPRLGEGNIQQGRVASRQQRPSVFPQSLGALQNLGRRLGGPTGGAVRVPSGQTIR